MTTARRRRKQRITCTDVYRHICDNLDRKLDAPACREIRRHIGRCPNCVAYLDGLKKTVALYQEYPDPRVPGKVHRQLYAMLKFPAGRRRNR